uniref:Uncharacterized protein n=1 Tax=Arundo donax TaxID=35708 RepID=A0A0A9D8E6_ARUDO
MHGLGPLALAPRKDDLQPKGVAGGALGAIQRMERPPPLGFPPYVARASPRCSPRSCRRWGSRLDLPRHPLATGQQLEQPPVLGSRFTTTTRRAMRLAGTRVASRRRTTARAATAGTRTAPRRHSMGHRAP